MREDFHHRQPLARVGAAERLIQNKDFRVVDQSLSDLGALAHAFGTLSQGTVGNINQLNDAQRGVGCLAHVWQAMQTRRKFDKLADAQERIEALLLRHQADASIELRIVDDRLAQHPHLPAAGPQQPGEQFDGGGFACAVGAKQGRHPWSDGE